MSSSIKPYMRKLTKQLAGSDPATVQLALTQLESLENIGMLKLQTVPSIFGTSGRSYKTTTLGRSALKRLMQIWDTAGSITEFVFKGTINDKNY